MEAIELEKRERAAIKKHFDSVFEGRRKNLQSIKGTVSDSESKLIDRTRDHVVNVSMGLAWMKDHGLLNDYLNDDEAKELDSNVETHDFSKIFSPEELEGYSKYHFPDTKDEGKLKEIKDIYQKAKVHHQNSNKHHSEYWVKIDDNGKIKPLDMDVVSILEMICDWWSFNWSKEDLNGIFDWYDSKKKDILMSDKTKRTVEDILSKIKKELEETK